MVNKRSPQQWEIIKDQWLWKDSYVIDYGCGGCDLLLYAYDAGARVFGVDASLHQVPERLAVDKRNRFWETDIDEFLFKAVFPADVAICFATLPYLDDPDWTLGAIYTSAELVLLEVQYAFDGPGFPDIKNDKDMEKKLRNLLPMAEIENLGYTTVDYRGVNRTIWSLR